MAKFIRIFFVLEFALMSATGTMLGIALDDTCFGVLAMFCLVAVVLSIGLIENDIETREEEKDE